MNRSTLARRYAPLVVVIAIQLLIIAVAPSKAPSRVAAGLGLGNSAGGTVGGDGTVTGDGGVVGADGTVTGGSVTGGTSSGGEVVGGGTTSGGGTRGGTGGGGGGGPTGDTSHCVGGRQYDPKIFAFAPACMAKFKGDNGGKTSPLGVDGKTIKVVVMRGNYGVAVNNALKAAGSLPGDEEFNAFLQAAVQFINSHYELYGRKIVAEAYQIKSGTGGQGKPDDQSLREEMKTMVQDKKPFAVIWSTPVSSATFDELSDLGVLNLGGYFFTDSFNQEHAPYHWDVQTGGNQLAQHVADWWCKRMYGNGAAKAQYADHLGNTDLKTLNRRLGVIATNDPDNVALVRQLDGLIKAKCGDGASFGSHFYHYDQDVSTADQQRQAAVSKMIQDPPATSVMCFCDQVAPFFLYDQEEKQNYYPENIFVSTGFTDLDSTVQTYDHQLSPTRAKDQYPEMENAFGLAQAGKQRAADKNDAAAVWRATGHTGKPYATADAQGDWEYYAMLGSLLQLGGPNLNATSIMQNAQRAPAIVVEGMSDQYNQGSRGFGPGDFTWNDTVREVYWSPTGKAEYNGVTGAWRSLNNGKWYRRGEVPNVLITLPPKPRA